MEEPTLFSRLFDLALAILLALVSSLGSSYDTQSKRYDTKTFWQTFALWSPLVLFNILYTFNLVRLSLNFGLMLLIYGVYFLVSKRRAGGAD